MELFLSGELQAYSSPAMIGEYQEVLIDSPELLAKTLPRLELCYPLTELEVIRHWPDNRFLECALVASADFIVTVNTAKGHFDRPNYQNVRVVTPGAFLNLPEVDKLLRKRFGDF